FPFPPPPLEVALMQPARRRRRRAEATGASRGPRWPSFGALLSLPLLMHPQVAPCRALSTGGIVHSASAARRAARRPPSTFAAPSRLRLVVSVGNDRSDSTTAIAATNGMAWSMNRGTEFARGRGGGMGGGGGGGSIGVDAPPETVAVAHQQFQQEQDQQYQQQQQHMSPFGAPPQPGAAAPAATAPAEEPWIGWGGAEEQHSQHQHAVPDNALLQPAVHRLPAGAGWRAAVTCMVPAAAALGFQITPSRYFPVRAVGALLFAAAGRAGRATMVAGRQRQAPPALLELVRAAGAASALTHEEVLAVARRFHLSDKALAEASAGAYAALLRDAAARPLRTQDELSELLALRKVLRLGGEEAAGAHENVAQRAIDQGLEGRQGPLDLDKLLYLSERVYFSEDNVVDDAYLQRCGRLRQIFGGLSQVELLRQVAAYASPFYKHILDDVTLQPAAYSAEVLLRTRRRLGISEAVAGGMHLDAFHDKVARTLQEKGGKIDDADKAALARLRGVMGVSQFEGERALESVTVPLYRDAVAAALAEVAGLPWGDVAVEACRQRLRQRQTDLQLSQAAAEAALKETLRKRAQTALEAAVGALRGSSGTLAGLVAGGGGVAGGSVAGAGAAGDGAMIVGAAAAGATAARAAKAGPPNGTAATTVAAAAAAATTAAAVADIGGASDMNGGAGASDGANAVHAEVLRAMDEVFRLRESASLLLSASPSSASDADVAKYVAGLLTGSPSLRLTVPEKAAVYSCVLKRCASDMRLDEEDKARLWELRAMLQLQENDAFTAYKTTVMPLVMSRLRGIAEAAAGADGAAAAAAAGAGGFSMPAAADGAAGLAREAAAAGGTVARTAAVGRPAGRRWDSQTEAAAVRQLEEDLMVPHQLFADAAMEVYHAMLSGLVADGSVPTKAEKAGLDRTALAFMLTPGQIETIHDITCASAYAAAAAAEAVRGGPGGASAGPAPATVDAADADPGPCLEVLRRRLGMSEGTARSIFIREFQRVLSPSVRSVFDRIEELIAHRASAASAAASAAAAAPSAAAVPGKAARGSAAAGRAAAEAQAAAEATAEAAAVAAAVAPATDEAAAEIMEEIYRLAGQCEAA
ncbi:unnamed protein product, partial [Phaeothamnion confervicola]